MQLCSIVCLCMVSLLASGRIGKHYILGVSIVYEIAKMIDGSLVNSGAFR